MMFLTKRHLDRRTMLRGLGAAVSLPLLDSMLPAQSPIRKSTLANRTRLACIEMVHGSAGSTIEGAKHNYWSPAKEGADFAWSYSLEPLAALRDYVSIISHTEATAANAHSASERGGDHFRSSAVFLTAAHARQ